MLDPSPFPRPQLSPKTNAEIEAEAEAFARELDFLPGDRIEPAVQRHGGEINYLDATAPFRDEDGSLVVYGPRQFRIYLSAFTGPERDRFTIAHELGHYVLHSDRGKLQIQAARFGKDPVELQANRFAASFLMPEADFRAACATYRNDIHRVAAQFLVSIRAAEVRMASLRIAP